MPFSLIVSLLTKQLLFRCNFWHAKHSINDLNIISSKFNFRKPSSKIVILVSWNIDVDFNILHVREFKESWAVCNESTSINGIDVKFDTNQKIFLGLEINYVSKTFIKCNKSETTQENIPHRVTFQ